MKTKRILAVLVVIALLMAAVSITAVIGNKKNAELEMTYSSELEKTREDLESLQAQLQIAEDGRQDYQEEPHAESNRTEYGEALIDLICSTDYNDQLVYVIGHQTPDSDTVASAIGMAHFLNALGISAEARVTGRLNLETEYAFSELRYPAPEILEDASGKQLWLVDHSTGTQMVNGAENARIVGIVDHHGIGDVENSELICVLSCPAGSTCSLVAMLCDVCGVELPEDIAGVLLAGLLSDTSNMKGKTVTRLDETAFANLKGLSGIHNTDSFYNGMQEAKLSYKGLNDTEIFYSDYKDYEHNGFRYGIGCIKVARAELIPAMAERMKQVILTEVENGCEADFLLFSIYDVDYSTGYMGYAGENMSLAEEIMAGTFGSVGQKQGEYYVFTPSLSRKTEVVPPLDAYLDTLK